MNTHNTPQLYSGKYQRENLSIVGEKITKGDNFMLHGQSIGASKQHVLYSPGGHAPPCGMYSQ